MKSFTKSNRLRKGVGDQKQRSQTNKENGRKREERCQGKSQSVSRPIYANAKESHEFAV